MLKNIICFIKFILLLPVIVPLRVYDKLFNRHCPFYGIEAYVGLNGYGKTISMTHRLNQIRKKYGHDVYIMTNYFYDKQDFEFKSWKQLLDSYDKPLVVAWDEIQNEFHSRDFQNFPSVLMTELTQLRKGNGIQILYTAPYWDGCVDKVFRQLTMYVWQCRTNFGRYTIAKKYHMKDYRKIESSLDENKIFRVSPIEVVSFVQTKKERNSYDSYKRLASSKNKEYMDRKDVVFSGLNFD